eukprot:TRINITY_DN1333_c0_g2_i2.p1 TRINITY_DN1333_c0_g2~~TRINITY_DN1333_c0_g2_i2.p1  ORF type:complete len:286 (-),score=72.73 TRINITY_DN1333_c0_g2_i2:35-829(-)
MASADECKNKGNTAFTQKDYLEAVKWYTEGLNLDPKNHVLWSNLAAANIELKHYDVAVQNCDKSIKVNPKWIKGYYRQAQALAELKLFDQAIATLQKGIKEVPTDKDLERKLAETKQQQAEYNKHRLKGKDGKPLIAAEEAKEQGNEAFKKALFEKAVDHYSRGIMASIVTNAPTELLCTLLNNRAACNLQLHNHKSVIQDCTEVLKHQPQNVKSLMRRGLAYEYTEKWKDALADLTKARELDPNAKQAADAITRIKKVQHNFS